MNTSLKLVTIAALTGLLAATGAQAQSTSKADTPVSSDRAAAAGSNKVGTGNAGDNTNQPGTAATSAPHKMHRKHMKPAASDAATGMPTAPATSPKG